MNKHQEIGNKGVYVGDTMTIAYTIDTTASRADEGFEDKGSADGSASRELKLIMHEDWQLLERGAGNRGCDDIEADIKSNRLLPSLINKQVSLLYGRGPRIYTLSDDDDGINRNWTKQEQIQEWLESWQDNGLDMDYKAFASACIKSFYFFQDYFCKMRFSLAPGVKGATRLAGLEHVDNRYCRLASKRKTTDKTPISYSDFVGVAFGDRSKNAYKMYKLFRLSELDSYKDVAISHHRESSPGEIYGLNEVYEGIKIFLRTSNDLPQYIRSFLANSLAAKVHVVIPNAWVEAKKKQMTALCNENARRQKNGDALVQFEGIHIGTEYQESNLSLLIQKQLNQIALFLTGAKNQGKAFSSYSFIDSNGNEQRWKIEPVDLKYKEYIEALDNHDKRIDEVLVSSVGLDSSISAIAKPGMISKSGSDTYYNLLLYLMTLTRADEICSEAFNLAIKVNFPELYKQGYRIGYYRPVPAKHSETPPENRLSNTASE